MRSVLVGLALTALAASGGRVGAEYILVQTVSPSGPYNNGPGLIVNGSVPAEWTEWTASSNVWWQGTATSFRLDFGSVYVVQDVLVSVDNNDDLRIDYSTDGTSFTNLVYIDRNYG